MGRPGLTQHRKFRRLERALGSAPLARGALELMWDVAYENGDEYLGGASDVEAAARWEGEPGALVKALLGSGGDGNAGFIEEIPDRPGHYRIHDLFENSPEYVQKRMVRELERKQRGVTISDLRREAGKRGRAAQLSRQTAANVEQTADTCSELGTNVGQVSGNCRANGDTPAPAPALKAKNNTSKPEGSDESEFDKSLKSVWDYYIVTIGKSPKVYSWSSKRKNMGAARLRELSKRAGSLDAAVSLMKLCVDRLADSRFHNGKNDNGKKYLDWETLFRDMDRTERWLDDDRFASSERGDVRRTVRLV